ncbi:MAG TPA: helicase-related protein, partial [Tepidisphaeraceae bacterium]
MKTTEKNFRTSRFDPARRATERPAIEFPAALPVVEQKAAIAEMIARHQVVILSGETGSGKTTQLPKICLEMGRGLNGLIGHTQPRRIAARTVAQRIADELHTPLGQAVGYKIRFTDQTRPETFIKLMTDGILLAETQTDRDLRMYDTIILDEAHERSLNIDFLMGYLKRLLPRRPDLKLIVTSATIDPERFSRHFNDAPMIQVSGRTFPVETRYRPLRVDERTPPEGVGGTIEIDDNDDDADLTEQQGIAAAVSELSAEQAGDVLIFLPTERDIRETAENLAGQVRADTDILPLFSRLSAAEQMRVFTPDPKRRRIVLATNVAETSVTVPGIGCVIDTGLARISRYST